MSTVEREDINLLSQNCTQHPCKKSRKSIVRNIKTIDVRNHSFNVGIATDFNPIIALWLGHLSFWTEKNLANNRHIHDGLAWCYDTLDAICDYFPYFTRRQVETMINNSVEYGLVTKGNYNHTGYDRTCWYALTHKAYFYFKHLLTKKNLKRLFASISQKCEMDFTEMCNRFHINVTAIPDANPNPIPDECIGDANASTSAHTNVRELEKQKAEQKTLDSPEVKELFESKFGGRTVSIEQLFEDCREHYDQKSTWATKKKFLNWLKREKTDNYAKKDSHVAKKSTVIKNFTDEEQSLLDQYKHYLKLWGKTKKIEEWFTNAEKRKRILELVEKEKEILDANTGRLQENTQ